MAVTKKNLLNRVDSNTYLKAGTYRWQSLVTAGTTNLALSSNASVISTVQGLDPSIIMRQVKTYTIS